MVKEGKDIMQRKPRAEAAANRERDDTKGKSAGKISADSDRSLRRGELLLATAKRIGIRTYQGDQRQSPQAQR